ncbi:MAG TPA: hypothetical protein VIK91_01015 [Nannocystis sp.]
MRRALCTFGVMLLSLAPACGGGAPAKTEPAKTGAVEAPRPAAVEGDYCTAIFTKMLACAPAQEREQMTPLKDLAIGECRGKTGRDPEEEKRELECVAKASCEEYRACLDAFALWRAQARIERAAKTGENMAEAVSSCKHGELKDSPIQEVCAGLYKKAFDAGVVTLAAIRDRGEDGLGACFDLRDAAELLSPEAQAQAETLCKEAEASKRAKEALAEAKKNLESGTFEVPFQCGMAVEELEMAGSEWAKSKLQEVLQGCYVELGKKILPAQVGKMRICEYQVELVYKAVKKFALEDPAIDPWIAKAARKCDGAGG